MNAQMIRRLVVCAGLAVAMFSQAAVRRAGAQELFYQAYEEGIKAFEAGQLDLAARRLQRALELDSAQSRQKRFYGMTFRPYVPEFYLGLIAARQKQYQRALDYFQRVEKAGLLRKGDKEYERLIAERTTAQNSLTSAPAVAANEPPPGRPPPPATPEPPPPSDGRGRGSVASGDRPNTEPPVTARVEEPKAAPPPAAPAGRVETPPPAVPPANAGAAAGLRADFDSQLKQRQYEQAWTTAGRMSAGDARPAYAQARAAIKRDLQDQMASGDLREADRLLGVARRTMKDDADLARFTQTLGDRRRVSTAERQSLTLLLEGEYQQSIALAEPLAKEKKASPRLLFYLACSHAGIALLSKEDAAAQLKAARELFAQTGSDAGIASAHARYISPRILEALRDAPR
jgi:tetratricopeptide (TPR) repeat protein